MDTGEKQHRSLSTGTIIRRWLCLVLLLLFCLFFMLLIFSQRVEISSNEMSPTLLSGDTVLLDMVSYRLRRPRRNELAAVTLKNSSGEEVVMLRRVIGLPGETVQIHDGHVYINGTALSEDNIDLTSMVAGAVQMPMTLSEDQYFLLCDDRSVIADSRDAGIGLFSSSQIKGRAFCVLLPVTRMTILS